jgi:hypothetical protein
MTCTLFFDEVRMVSDLHRLVTFAAPQERPLLLVGSEVGGLVARAFAHLHPQAAVLFFANLRKNQNPYTPPPQKKIE